MIFLASSLDNLTAPNLLNILLCIKLVAKKRRGVLSSKLRLPVSRKDSDSSLQSPLLLLL
eukprot:11310976-Heterocapsa_arctica.AAC.1